MSGTTPTLTGPAAKQHKVVLLIPVFNDWDTVTELLRWLNRALLPTGRDFEVVLVDDGSTSSGPVAFLTEGPVCLESVRVLELRRNLGHQRAIAIGLVHLHASMPDHAVLVMDGDGFVLKASMPTPTQIHFWDTKFVPLSRLLDPICGHMIGKSVLGVWTAPLQPPGDRS